IFASDMERIAQGKGEYAGISKQLRRDCLANVLRLISDEALGVDLVIIDSGGADGIRKAFRDYDSVGVFDESFVLWRYHSGRIAWSEDPEQTRKYRRLLKTLQSSATNGGLQSTNTSRAIRTFAESITE